MPLGKKAWHAHILWFCWKFTALVQWQIKRDKLQMCWSLLMLDCCGLVLLVSQSFLALILQTFGIANTLSQSGAGSSSSQCLVVRLARGGAANYAYSTIIIWIHDIRHHWFRRQFDTTSRISVDWNNAWCMHIPLIHHDTWGLPL